MHTHKDAEAAIEALDNRHVWEGMNSPMVVKWMDNALQRRRREQHIAAMRQGLLPSMSLGERHHQLVPDIMFVEKGIIHPGFILDSHLTPPPRSLDVPVVVHAPRGGRPAPVPRRRRPRGRRRGRWPDGRFREQWRY